MHFDWMKLLYTVYDDSDTAPALNTIKCIQVTKQTHEEKLNFLLSYNSEYTTDDTNMKKYSVMFLMWKTTISNYFVKHSTLQV